MLSQTDLHGFGLGAMDQHVIFQILGRLTAIARRVDNQKHLKPVKVVYSIFPQMHERADDVLARRENEPAKREALDTDNTFDTMTFPIIDPDNIAARYWDMYTDRQQVETVVPEMAFGQ